MYTIREASARSGVGVPLLRAWERRYGVVEPVRTAAGYRLYDDEAINRLRAMRFLIASGWSAQQAAERIRGLDEAGLAEALEGERQASDGIGTQHEDPIRPGAAATLVTRMVEAARRIDGDELEAALDDAFSTARFEVVADHVVMPALRAIGEAWERDEVNVAGEHAASHAVLRRLAMAYEAAGEPSLDRPILVGLGAGGQHELGAFAFATAARRAGLPILYLGPNLPPESWIAAAETRDARGAVVGAPTVADVRRARDVIEALHAWRTDLLLAAGGDEAIRAVRGTAAVALPSDSLSESVAALRVALADRERSGAR